WLSAKSNLKETYESIENVYNIKDLQSGILKDRIK
ncbi:MAG TPA: restriction endonuclease, partial [Gallicola sp.]|nr:restriction endonuclease [Gallicola sp.]